VSIESNKMGQVAEGGGAESEAIAKILKGPPKPAADLFKNAL